MGGLWLCVTRQARGDPGVLLPQCWLTVSMRDSLLVGLSHTQWWD